MIINVIEEVRNQSRLFSEPPAPKPTRESIVKELAEVAQMIEDTRRAMEQELRRLENRVVLIKSKIEGSEVGL